MDKKVRVGVIFGGRSGEHEVSLNSAQSIMKALNPQKYEVVPIGITKQGQWLAGEAVLALTAGDTSQTHPVTLPPDPQTAALVGQNGHSEKTAVDVIIPVLHGPYGEDGTMQGLLELANIPYVGAGVLGSAVGMDKAVFKQVIQAHGLPVLPWQLVLHSTFQKYPEQVLDQLEKKLSYPMFVKPANLGSSVGIHKCHTRPELEAGLRNAGRYDRRLVVEQGATVREFEVSVLGNEAPQASVVGEVRPKREFYDYVAKYISDDSELFIPADISPELAQQIQEMAVQVFIAIDGAGLGRVDFLYDVDHHQLYVNEINTMPGFTNISMYPKLWEASGLSYPQLLDKLIELALERHHQKNQLETTFAPEM